MRIVAFALLLSTLVAVLCGAVPAWRMTRVDPQDALRGGRGGGAGREHHRALDVLVVVEVALSLVLLIGAGLTLKSFTKLLDGSPGFDPAPMLTMDVRISPKAYSDGATARQFLDPALEAIKRDPAIEAAGAIDLLPFDNFATVFGIRYDGQPAGDAAKRPLVQARVATPGFFDVTRQRLVAGRMLRASDEGAPRAPDVVLVNEALVKRDFHGQDPLGKRFYTGDTTLATIVGVVSDIRNLGPTVPPAPEIYESYRQGASGASGFEIVVRVKGGDPLAVSKSVQAAIRSVDKGAAISRIRPMNQVISSSVGQPRFLFSLMGVFAAAAVCTRRRRPLWRDELCRRATDARARRPYRAGQYRRANGRARCTPRRDTRRRWDRAWIRRELRGHRFAGVHAERRESAGRRDVGAVGSRDRSHRPRGGAHSFVARVAHRSHSGDSNGVMPWRDNSNRT